jgi:Fe-S-cluster containining protein
VLRKTILALVIADNFVANLAGSFFRKKWKLEGSCKKCGKCCRDIHLKIDPRLLNNRFTRELVIRWISWLFRFYLKRIDHERNYLVFGCRNLTENGTCGDYRWRPNVCRNYPLVDFFDEPALFDTCGYKAKLR